MKTKLIAAFILGIFSLAFIPARTDEQTRKVEPFTEISLRIAAKVHLEQGEKQSVVVIAKPSTLDELITEVKDGKLIIRFPTKDVFWKTFQPGEITINITVPEINGLSISGSGDIIAEDHLKTKILDMAISGSGNIRLSDLAAERVKAAISGSGDIVLAGKTPAQDLSVAISGSGNLKAMDFSSDDVTAKVSGSGNVSVGANNNLFVRLVGSGNVTYKGKPRIDSSIAGSGKVKNAN
jgi:hypothetical protein